ncbi:MAG: hypothetical protein M1357_03100 [Candidatus Marsarchaeota archaeon]|nr:hypothetical protein [Candidatus Marsarchaeota archaeon]
MSGSFDMVHGDLQAPQPSQAVPVGVATVEPASERYPVGLGAVDQALMRATAYYLL